MMPHPPSTARTARRTTRQTTRPSRPIVSVRVLMSLGWLLLWFVAGCDNSTTTGGPDPIHGDGAAPATPIRVVTLSPALTQCVIDLGYGRTLVGVAENDNAAPKDLPVVGNYLDPNRERLLAVRPTHVLLMVGKEGTPKALADLAASQGFEVVGYPYPTDLIKLYNIIMAVPDPTKPPSADRSLASIFDAPGPALILFHRMTFKLNAIAQAIGDRPRPRALVVIGLNPVMASGPGTVFDEVLRSFARGQNAAEDATVSAPTFDREKVLAARPEVILLTLPGAAGPLGPIDQDPRLAEFRGLDVPAVANNRIVLINDPLIHLPATHLPRVAAELARALHPDLSAAIDAALNSEPPIKPLGDENPGATTPGSAPPPATP